MLYSQSISASWDEDICIVSIDMVSSLPQEMDGLLSRPPVMHLLWKPRLLKRSRLPKESEHVKPENELLP